MMDHEQDVAAGVVEEIKVPNSENFKIYNGSQQEIYQEDEGSRIKLNNLNAAGILL